jgi:APA family basic amino acid/polyamine antiporter
VILIVLYAGANFAYHGVLSMEEVEGAEKGAAKAMIHKLLLPSGTHVAELGAAAMAAVIMCGALGAINSTILEGSRIAFAMGRDDLFFRSLGLVHVNYRTPAMAIIVMGVLSAALVIGTAVLVETVPSLEGHTDVFDFLTEFVVFSGSLFYMLAVFAVIVLRRRHPEWDRPYRTPGFPLVPVVYVLFSVWFLYYIYIGSPLLANIGLGLVALGVPVYFAWQAWARRHPPAEDGGGP